MTITPTRVATTARHGLLLVLPLLALTAEAGEPPPAEDAAQVFARAAPSVLTLTVRDEQGNEIGVRSAVSLGSGKAVSTCDGGVASDMLTLTSGGRSWPATITAYDDERNLCQLAAPGLDIAPLTVGSSAPTSGRRVFAISNALGYGIGISEGTLAAVRKTSAGDYLQFSAPVSPGSQGGALVDTGGRLLGLIDYRQRKRGQRRVFEKSVLARRQSLNNTLRLLTCKYGKSTTIGLR
jgi:S1-C subfamily serine protease